MFECRCTCRRGVPMCSRTLGYSFVAPLKVIITWYLTVSIPVGGLAPWQAQGIPASDIPATGQRRPGGPPVPQRCRTPGCSWRPPAQGCRWCRLEWSGASPRPPRQACAVTLSRVRSVPSPTPVNIYITAITASLFHYLHHQTNRKFRGKSSTK